MVSGGFSKRDTDNGQDEITKIVHLFSLPENAKEFLVPFDLHLKLMSNKLEI